MNAQNAQEASLGAGFPQESVCCRLPENEPGLPKKRRRSRLQWLLLITN
jgi:hypothetical protein